MRALILASILSAASFASPAFATINECPMKIDFTSADDVRAWRAVNDGVMGGLWCRIQQRRSRRNRHHHSRRKRWPVRDED